MASNLSQGFTAGSNARLQKQQLGQNALLLEQKQQEINARKQQAESERLQKLIENNFSVAQQIVDASDQSGVSRDDPKFLQAIKPLFDQSVALATNAIKSGYTVTPPEFLIKKGEAFLMQPTLQQRLENEANKKRTLSKAETEGKAEGNKEQVLNKQALEEKKVNEQVRHNKATESRLSNPVEQVPTAPTENDLEAVSSLVNSDDDLKSMENKDEFSLAVASRAREIMKQEKKGFYSASQQALKELKQNIDPAEQKDGLFGWDFLAKDKPASFNPNKEQTATNPKTGEKIIFKDGQWMPYE